MRGNRVAVLCVALLTGLPVSAPAQATHFPDDPGCGNLSPFGNVCTDGPVRLSPHAEPDPNLLGFTGRLTITLRQDHGVPPHGYGQQTWVCDAIMTQPAITCVELPMEGLLIPLREAMLRCVASGHPVFLGLAPPVGTWGCGVDM